MIVPKEFPSILADLAKILQFLAQLNYNLAHRYKKTILIKVLETEKITTCFNSFKLITNALVKDVFFKEYSLKTNQDFSTLDDLINSNPAILKNSREDLHISLLNPKVDLSKAEINKNISDLSQILEKLGKKTIFWSQIKFSNDLIKNSKQILNI